MPRLFIRLISPVEHDEGEPRLGAEWLLLESDGTHRGHGVTDYRGLTELTDLDADWLSTPDNIVVFLPTEYVLNVPVTVPGGNVGQIRKALPFAVEEFIAGDIDGMHLAHGPISKGEPTVCNLVDRAMLRDWLACLGEIGLSPGYMHADAQCLPQETDKIALLFDAGEVLVASQQQLASVDRDNLTLALSALVEEAGVAVPQTVVQINDSLSELEQSEVDGDLRFESLGHDGGGLSYFAQRWVAGHRGVNLLQGDFAPKRERSASTAAWRGVGVLAAAWAVVALIGMGVEAWWADQRIEQLKIEQASLFQETFDRRARVPVREWKMALAGSAEGGGASLPVLLGELVRVGGAGLRLRNLRYSAERGDIQLDLTLPSFDRVDTLQQELTAAGASVDISNAEEDNGLVNVQLRLALGDAS